MTDRSRYIYALGVLFLLFAAGHAVLNVVREGALLEAGLDLVLIGLPGVSLLYVGRWLASTDFEPALYPRIALWCVGGVVVMLVFIVLRAVHPGVTVHWTFGTRAIALSIGSIAGLGIGIHEAQARSRERELERRNDELKRTKATLKERNEELVETRESLETAMQRVEASNDRLEQFASAASHDLQEPLRMVTSYLQLLEDRCDDALDEEATEFLEFAMDGATRMETMVEDLLALSRVETRGDPVGTSDLESVVDDVRRDLTVRIDESDAEITTDELPRVEGDESQLRQLFQNLFSNAIAYSGDEPPRIHVSAERRGSEQVISVTDEGIGIESDDQERIFESFQRLHSVDDHAGSGIGLALCRRIVERHDGEIGVESDLGDGSTFTFTVPVADDRQVHPDASPSL